VTFKQLSLCKPLNETETQTLQQLADGIPTAKIAVSHNTSRQVIKTHNTDLLKDRGRQSRPCSGGSAAIGGNAIASGLYPGSDRPPLEQSLLSANEFESLDLD
jgi:hypothetical protein